MQTGPVHHAQIEHAPGHAAPRQSAGLRIMFASPPGSAPAVHEPVSGSDTLDTAGPARTGGDSDRGTARRWTIVTRRRPARGRVT